MAETTAIERRRTDILVLGAGGAGLLAALHAKDAAPQLDVTIAVKGCSANAAAPAWSRAAITSPSLRGIPRNATSWTRSKAASG